MTLLELTPFVKDSYPTLKFAQLGLALAALPHPYDGQVVTLTYSGSLYFAGDSGTRQVHYQQGIGWVFEWDCFGLAKRAEYIPVTDALTLTDTARYNLASDDPDYSAQPGRAARWARSWPKWVSKCPSNAAPLAAAGLMNSTSLGTGAAAAVTVLTGGAVTTIAVSAGGTGYTTAPTVFLSGRERIGGHRHRPRERWIGHRGYRHGRGVGIRHGPGGRALAASRGYPGRPGRAQSPGSIRARHCGRADLSSPRGGDSTGPFQSLRPGGPAGQPPRARSPGVQPGRESGHPHDGCGRPGGPPPDHRGLERMLSGPVWCGATVW